MPAKLGKVRRS